MLGKLLNIGLMAFICACSITMAFGQEETEKTKVVIIEKEVDDNGNVKEVKKVLQGKEAEEYLKDNEEGRMWITEEGKEIELNGRKAKMLSKQAYKIKVKDENGEEKILEWDGEGEMPEEMKALMDQQGMEIDVEMEKGDGTVQKKQIKLLDSDSGEMMEWDGEGEMPDNMKKLLEKEGIDLEKLMGDAIQEAVEKTQTITMDDAGQTKKMKIITKGGDSEDVMELEWEGDEMPEEVKEVLKKEGISVEEVSGAEGQKELRVAKKEVKKSGSAKKKAQLGVMIEAHPSGVRVSDVVPETSAAIGGMLGGDIITAVDDQPMSSTDDLIKYIGTKGVGDVIIVHFTRAGQAQSEEITLRERVDPFPFKTWDDVMNKGSK